MEGACAPRAPRALGTRRCGGRDPATDGTGRRWRCQGPPAGRPGPCPSISPPPSGTACRVDAAVQSRLSDTQTERAHRTFAVAGAATSDRGGADPRKRHGSRRRAHERPGRGPGAGRVAGRAIGVRPSGVRCAAFPDRAGRVRRRRPTARLVTLRCARIAAGHRAIRSDRPAPGRPPDARPAVDAGPWARRRARTDAYQSGDVKIRGSWRSGG